MPPMAMKAASHPPLRRMSSRNWPTSLLLRRSGYSRGWLDKGRHGEHQTSLSPGVRAPSNVIKLGRSLPTV